MQKFNNDPNLHENNIFDGPKPKFSKMFEEKKKIVKIAYSPSLPQLEPARNFEIGRATE